MFDDFPFAMLRGDASGERSEKEWAEWRERA
jgi:hypothetical protein